MSGAGRRRALPPQAPSSSAPTPSPHRHPRGFFRSRPGAVGVGGKLRCPASPDAGGVEGAREAGEPGGSPLGTPGPAGPELGRAGLPGTRAKPCMMSSFCLPPNCGVGVGRWCQLKGLLPGGRRPLEKKIIFEVAVSVGGESLEDACLWSLLGGLVLPVGISLTFGGSTETPGSPLRPRRVAGAGRDSWSLTTWARGPGRSAWRPSFLSYARGCGAAGVECKGKRDWICASNPCGRRQELAVSILLPIPQSLNGRDKPEIRSGWVPCSCLHLFLECLSSVSSNQSGSHTTEPQGVLTCSLPGFLYPYPYQPELSRFR